MKQRILVIKEVLGERNELAFALIEPYIKERLDEGSYVNVHETNHKTLKMLLEEEDIFKGDITQDEIDLMFDINTYDQVFYVPQDAEKSADILVYDPEKLDKNMIFYYIGNMNVRESHLKFADAGFGESAEFSDSVQESVNENKVLWLMVSFIPWLVFILMNLLGYSNISGIPLIIAVMAIVAKKASKNRYRDFVAEISNAGFFLLILISNYSSASWLANICIPLTVMGMILMFLISLVKWEEA